MRKKIRYVEASMEESKKELVNPYRGWYTIWTFSLRETPDWGELSWNLPEEESLVLVRIDLDGYQHGRLDEEALGRFSEILTFFREHRKQVILRPVYDLHGNAKNNEPKEIFLIREHLEQLGRVLAKTHHSVWIFQGLLIGSWGEMHSSEYITEENIRELAGVIRHFLGETLLAVRTPAQWRILTTKENWKKGQETHLTVFDDGILGSGTHLGTFGMMTVDGAGWTGAWTRVEELRFLHGITGLVPCGGEALASVDGNCPETVEETLKRLRKMRLSYLNREHDKRRIESWKNTILTDMGEWNGYRLYDYIGAHLGYRLVIRRAEGEVRGLRKKRLRLSIEVENCGFAGLYQDVKMKLLLQGAAGKKETISKEIPGRTWEPGEKQIFRFEIPAMEGELYLSLSEVRTRRTIFFANENIPMADRVRIGCLTMEEKKQGEA